MDSVKRVTAMSGPILAKDRRHPAWNTAWAGRRRGAGMGKADSSRTWGGKLYARDPICGARIAPRCGGHLARVWRPGAGPGGGDGPDRPAPRAPPRRRAVRGREADPGTDGDLVRSERGADTGRGRSLL